jgi:cbb3-type cytochrome oxidase subunit 3
MDKNIIKAILLILLGIIFIALIIFFLFFFRGQPQDQDAANRSLANISPGIMNIERPINLENGSVLINDRVVKYVPRNNREELEIKLGNKAKLIAERFGSFSNHSDYENIKDLEIHMTEKMKQWSVNYISKSRSESSGREGYYGISTKAISTEVKQLNEDSGQAEFYISTQRIESREDSRDDRVFYQGITIKFVLTKGEWLVDSIYWQ